MAFLLVRLSEITVSSSDQNSHPRYRSSVFSLTTTRSILLCKEFALGYAFKGLIFAYKSKSCRMTSITSAALSPTGPFKHASDLRISDSVKSGSALLYLLSAPSPASTGTKENFTDELSFIAFRIHVA